MEAVIEAWREFYGAVANAAAALLGLVFVGLSLHLGLRRPTAPIGGLALGSAVVLVQPMLVALVMLIPHGAPGLHALGTLVLSAVAAAQIAAILLFTRVRRQISSGWLLYRYGIPLVASALLAGGSLGMLAEWPPAVFAPALFVFAMFVVGVQDAWDLLTYPSTLPRDGPGERPQSETQR